eukprot:184857-Ditylum_brightwellii.AAC.1
MNKVIIPCNIGNQHWACLVAHMDTRRIEYYDSIGGCGNEFTVPFLRYLMDEWEVSNQEGEFESDSWIVSNMTRAGVPHQTNRELQFNQSDVSTMRKLIILTILGRWSIDDE